MYGPLISLIIPIYKVELYIKNCIDSILSQSYKDLEIILIDDGSPDDSGMIADEYAKIDSRIIVVHKTNGGLSSARNAGIKIANGKYLVFVDSDDYISNDLSDLLFELINVEEIDFIMCNYNRIYNDRMEIEGINSRLIEQRYIVDDDLRINIINNTKGLYPAWKNIVSRNFIINNNLFFKEGYLHEDVDWTSRIILKMGTFFYSNKSWYNYISERQGSIMNTLGYKSISHILDIAKDLIDFSNNAIDNSLLSKAFNQMLSKSCYSTLAYYKKLSKDDKELLITKYNDNLKIFSYSLKAKHRIFYRTAKLIGIKKALGLMNIINDRF